MDDSAFCCLFGSYLLQIARVIFFYLYVYRCSSIYLSLSYIPIIIFVTSCMRHWMIYMERQGRPKMIDVCAPIIIYNEFLLSKGRESPCSLSSIHPSILHGQTAGAGGGKEGGRAPQVQGPKRRQFRFVSIINPSPQSSPPHLSHPRRSRSCCCVTKRQAPSIRKGVPL